MGQRNDVAESISEIFTRMQEKAAERQRASSSQLRTDSELGHDPAPVLRPRRNLLLPDRHPTRDFFVADILDWALKDDRHSMEHPIFSLSKNPDRRVRHYEHNGNSVTIKPGADGLATIWDKDVLIYLVSQVVEGLNRSRTPHRSSRGAWCFLGNRSICWLTKAGRIKQAIVLEHGNEYAQEPIGHTAECAGI